MLADKRFRSTSMKAGRVWSTMEEECREILHSVEEALAQEMRPEMRGAPGCAAPDGARIAACLHLQRAALDSVMMQRRSEWRASDPNASITCGWLRAPVQ
jgi:hypothetical protein